MENKRRSKEEEVEEAAVTHEVARTLIFGIETPTTGVISTEVTITTTTAPFLTPTASPLPALIACVLWVSRAFLTSFPTKLFPLSFPPCSHCLSTAGESRQTLTLVIVFKPEAFDRLLLLNTDDDAVVGGEGGAATSASSAGSSSARGRDYYGVLLIGGVVEFCFDCGSGAAVIKSQWKVNLGVWNTIKIHR